MKIKNILILVFALFLSMLTNKAFSQWEEGSASVNLSLPEIALVDIEPDGNNNIYFSITPSSESGGRPVVQENANETLSLNYTSALASTQNSRSIVAEITRGNVPEGVLFYLEAATYSGIGRGQMGQPAGKIELSSQPRPIITGIGSCFTGDGVSNGHILHFSIEIADYSKIYSVDESNITVLYTITDN
ncbi:MAG: hypothetical protein J7L95_07300 [Prolixibacteraceae bacterium]|nr:hypothetical protein [Prolixibacteraceae bacterium]